MPKISPVGKHVIIESDKPIDFNGRVTDRVGRTLSGSKDHGFATGDTVFFTTGTPIEEDNGKFFTLVKLDDIIGRSLREPTREELENKRLKEEMDRMNAAYTPEKARRIVLENGDVAYESMSSKIVFPDEFADVLFGAFKALNKGFPGFPETIHSITAPLGDFKPEHMDIDHNFAVTGFFAGADNMFDYACSKAKIPAEAFLKGKPQPDYVTIAKGVSIQLSVVNVSDKPLAFRGRIVGKEI